MPFYLYECSECSHQFEEFKIIDESPNLGDEINRVIYPT